MVARGSSRAAGRTANFGSAGTDEFLPRSTSHGWRRRSPATGLHRRLRLSAYDRRVTAVDAPTLRPIRLTELTDCGGCAAKLGADLLAEALGGLAGGIPEPAELLAGLERADD